jgi:hypothetical protein
VKKEDLKKIKKQFYSGNITKTPIIPAPVVKCYYCKEIMRYEGNLCISCNIKLKKPFKETI